MKETKVGKMVSVYNQLFNNYLISLKFKEPLSLAKVRKFTDKS